MWLLYQIFTLLGVDDKANISSFLFFCFIGFTLDRINIEFGLVLLKINLFFLSTILIFQNVSGEP